MNAPFEQEIRYRLLKVLSNNPRLSQREMAKKMGISLGKVNYCLSELVKRGFIKINRFKSSKDKRIYIYLLTPKGVEEKAKLTLKFLKRKIVEYREIEQQIQDLAEEMEKEGVVHIPADDKFEWLSKVRKAPDLIDNFG